MVDLFYAGYEQGMSTTGFHLMLAEVQKLTGYLWA